MKFKTTMLMAFLLLSILAIGAVSAADGNETADALAVENDVDDVGLNSSDSDLTANDESVVLGEEPGTFTNLNDEIDACSQDTLVLSRNYDGDGTIISISKPITIDGDGHTLDAKGGRVFEITSNNVVIKNMNIINTFVNGSGGAVYSSGSGTIENCNFTNNSASNDSTIYFNNTGTVINCNFINNSAGDCGGAVLMISGTVSNCNFIDNTASIGGAINMGVGTVTNCNFINNSAGWGGAVFFWGYCNVTNCNFTGNQADQGGAIYFAEYLSVNVANCNFVNNTADYAGGAINFAKDSTGTVTNCNFVNNTADYAGGGAINFAEDSTGTVTNCNFTDNKAATGDYSHGGAINFAEDSTGTVKNCNFIGNKATGDYSYGGAIRMSSGTVSNCNFTGNEATGSFSCCGAIDFEDDGNVTNCNFINNFAFHAGGAILFKGNGTVTNCNFTDNRVTGSGGAIYFSGSGSVELCNFTRNFASGLGGGAVNMNSGNVTNCNFIKNYVNHGGGAIEIDSGTVTNCNFTDNSAGDCGGAIDMDSGTVSNCNFIDNQVTEDDSCGGAIEMYSGNVSNCNFTGNQATGSGGAIYFAEDSSGNVTNCNFTGNQATGSGGAIYFDENSIGSVINCNFANNSVSGDLYGGAIYFSSWGSTSIVIDCNFTDNSAGEGGGAIYFKSSGEVTNCNFINNFVNRSGGAIYFEGEGTVTNCNFINNSAADSYGGAVHIGGQGTVTNCSFINNQASGYNGCGGAVHFGDQGTVADCNFTSNMATGYGSSSGAIDFTSEGTVTNCNFINNHAADEYSTGGAISFWYQGNVINCTFVNNTADYAGGAIYFQVIEGTVTNCNFINNSASGLGGGAVYFWGNFNITDCNFTDNQATGSGGAIYFEEDSSGNVINCTFVNNHANNGGAIFVYETGSVLIYSSIFIENHANNNGGAVFSSKSDSVSIFHSRFTDNSAERGGAIYNCTFENCTVEGFGSQIYPDNKTVPSIEIVVDVLGDTAVIHVALPSDVEGNVTVALNGINQTVNVVNGVGNVTFSGLATGTFKVTVTFEGNDRYLKTANSTSFTVSKETPSLTINVDNMKPNESQTITVQLPDSATGNVTFWLYYEGLIFISKSCELSKSGVLPFNGAALEVNDLPIGSYNITVDYDGGDNYMETSDYALFTVSPWINVTNDVIKGDNLEISIDFGNLTNMTIRGNVRIYIDGEEYISQRISGSKLNCAISTEDIPLESHSVAFQYVGTTFSEDIFRLGAGKSYVPMAYEVHISPREIFIPSKLISDDMGDVVFEMPVDSAGMLAISLDTGESVAIINMSNYANRTDAFEETVSSVLADCEVSIKKTEDDRLIITMTFSQRKGEIGVVLEYTGDGKYSPFRKVATASVNHKSPVIIAGDLSMIYSSNRVYSVVVYGSDGKAAGGVQVSFMVNGRFIGSAFTNANGVAGIKITNAPGSYSITAKALGTGATKRLTVSHVLSLKTVKVKKSAKKLVLKATLKKVNGKYLKGKKITFKFNGKTYKAKTNKKGVAKVTVKKSVLKKLKAGKKIKYQATYLKDTVKKSAKVKK